MIRPGAPSGLSILLHEPYPGDDLGALVIWRQSPAPVGFGIRAGITEDPGGDLAALFGLDVSGTLARLQGSGDPEVLWWSGAGLGVGEELVATFPAGMVLGWLFVLPGWVRMKLELRRRRKAQDRLEEDLSLYRKTPEAVETKSPAASELDDF